MINTSVAKIVWRIVLFTNVQNTRVKQRKTALITLNRIVEGAVKSFGRVRWHAVTLYVSTACRVRIPSLHTISALYSDDCHRIRRQILSNEGVGLDRRHLRVAFRSCDALNVVPQTYPIGVHVGPRRT